MHRLVLILVVALASATMADTVFLSDGRQLRGTVTKDGTTVRIQTPDGKTISVKATDVLYISSDAPKPAKPTVIPELPDKAKPLPKPATPPKRPAGSANLPDFGDSTTKRTLRPEAKVFDYLRLLQANHGNENSTTASHLRRYRSYVHDQKRECNGRWVTPEEYVKRRAQAESVAREGASNLRKGDTEVKKPTIRQRSYRDRSGIQRSGYSDADRRRALEYRKKLDDIKAAAEQGRKQLHQAALIYPDDEVREFMLACSKLHGKSYSKAYIDFMQLCKKHPYMTIYQQGYALAAIKREKFGQALSTLTEAVKMDPTNQELREFLSLAMKKTPGNSIHRDLYQTAKDTLEATKPLVSQSSGYSSLRQSRSKTEEIRWRFPGKTVTSDQYSLPEPPYDRYSDFQGVGVPIGPHTLLVDSNVVAGNAHVVVRLDANTCVVGQAKRVYSRSRKSPFATIEVISHTFTPVALAKEDSIKDTKLVTILTTNYLPDLGEKLRSQSLDYQALLAGKPKDGAFPLLPGEAGAPLLNAKKELVGFLGGWTNCFEDNPAIQLADYKDLSRLVQSATRPPSRFSSAPTIDDSKLPQVKGSTFLIRAIRGERFKSK